VSHVTTLEPHRHQPPDGWSAETFETVTSALASALVAAYRRRHGDQDADNEMSESRKRGKPRPMSEPVQQLPIQVSAVPAPSEKRR
jgi:hypothetical protein